MIISIANNRGFFDTSVAKESFRCPEIARVLESLRIISNLTPHMTATVPAPTTTHTLTTSITPDVLMGAFAQILLIQPGHVMSGEKQLSNCGRTQAGWIGENALIDANIIFVSNDQIAQQTVSEIMLATEKDECSQCHVGELDLPAAAPHPLNMMLRRLGNAPLVNPGSPSRGLFGQAEAALLKRWALDAFEAMMQKSGDRYGLWAIVATTHVVGVQMLAWMINEILGDRNPNYAENKSLIELIQLKHGEAFRLEFLQDAEPYSMQVVLFTPPGSW